MWEIRFTRNGMEKRLLVKSAKRAFSIAKDLAGKGCRPRTRRLKTDVWLASSANQKMIRVMTRIDIVDAARWWIELAETNQNVGCVMWPSEKTMPDRWFVDDPNRFPSASEP